MLLHWSSEIEALAAKLDEIKIEAVTDLDCNITNDGTCTNKKSLPETFVPGRL